MVDVVNGLRPQQTEAAPGVIPQQSILVEIRVVNLDTLTCGDIGQGLNPSSPEYNVKLPYTFAPASRDGINYVYADLNNRTADATEVQQLTPEYLVLDQIWVRWIQDDDGSYVDCNFDGRQWAKVP